MALFTTLAYRQSEQSRARRTDLFLRLVRPGDSVLDLGGETGAYMASIQPRLPEGVSVTVADVDARVGTVEQYGFAAVPLDPREQRLPFSDGEFDVILCNSVLEHVTVPHDAATPFCQALGWAGESYHRQAAFASEIRRVGRSYFVQTPHRWSPVEAHFWLPAVGWLPHAWQHPFVPLVNRFWIKDTSVDFRLIGPGEMRTMFPDATIVTERWAGLPKSLIAVHSQFR